MNQSDAYRVLSDLVLAVAVNGMSEPISANVHLIRSGILDSMGVVELAARIESAFGVRLPPSAINPKNFGSLEKIHSVINQYLNEEA